MTNKVLEYNNKMVINEIKSLCGLIKSVRKSKNSSIIALGIFNYFILFAIEAINYIEITQNIIINYNYKTQLNSSRARIKEYTKDYNGILEDIKKINKKTYTDFYDKTSNFVKKHFSYMITNLGIYYYNEQIIGNTFLYEMDNKKIFLTNNVYDKNKIYLASIEVGKMLKNVLKNFGEEELDIKTKKENKILSKDYDVYTNNKLFNKNVDLNCCLLLLNILSVLNFYKYIIKDYKICDSLKYRIGYCVFYRSYYNLQEIIKSNTDFCKIKIVLDKYSKLDNRTFRNGIFHYNLQGKLKENELDYNDIYCGVLKKQLDLTTDEFKENIDNCIDEMSNEIGSLIFC